MKPSANPRGNSGQLTRLQYLYELGMRINSTFDIEEILKITSESLIREFGFDKSSAVYLDPASGKPMESASKGFFTDQYRRLIDVYERMVLPVLGKNKVVCLNLKTCTPPWAELLNSLGLRAMFVIPMKVKNRLTGFILAAKSRGPLRLKEHDQHYWSMFATQVSSAAENARLYDELGQSNITLEEKVQERTKDLMEANSRLRELDQIKSNFISMVSHELRTPLTAIKGFIVTLYHYDKEISAEKRHLYLKVLNEETDRLTRLITELLDISRIESGRVDMQWKEIYIPSLVQRVMDTLAIRAEQVHFEKDFAANFPSIVADPDKLDQVFINLIGNALKFSPVGGSVRIIGRRTPDEEVLIEVQDEGPGIPFSEQEKIFDKFYRGDNETNRKSPGTGLGLSICRALLNLHGGKIWVESEIGRGCRFVIRLPLNADKRLLEGLAA